MLLLLLCVVLFCAVLRCSSPFSGPLPLVCCCVLLDCVLLCRVAALRCGFAPCCLFLFGDAVRCVVSFGVCGGVVSRVVGAHTPPPQPLPLPFCGVRCPLSCRSVFCVVLLSAALPANCCRCRCASCAVLMCRAVLCVLCDAVLVLALVRAACSSVRQCGVTGCVVSFFSCCGALLFPLVLCVAGPRCAVRCGTMLLVLRCGFALRFAPPLALCSTSCPVVLCCCGLCVVWCSAMPCGRACVVLFGVVSCALFVLSRAVLRCCVLCCFLFLVVLCGETWFLGASKKKCFSNTLGYTLVVLEVLQALLHFYLSIGLTKKGDNTF